MILSWALTTLVGVGGESCLYFLYCRSIYTKTKGVAFSTFRFSLFLWLFYKIFLKISICHVFTFILLKIFLVLQLPLWWIYITLGGIETSSVDRHTTSETLVYGKYHFTIIIIKLIYPYLKKSDYLFFSPQ